MLTLKNVKKTCKAKHDSKVEDVFVLTHQKNGSVIKFKCQPNGLHAFTPLATHRNWKKQQAQDVDAGECSNLTKTVRGNVEGCKAQQVKKAHAAQELCHGVGPITKELFETQVQTNATRDCPIAVDDIGNARNTFGELMDALKGNCVRQQPWKKIVTHLPSLENLSPTTNRWNHAWMVSPPMG